MSDATYADSMLPAWLMRTLMPRGLLPEDQPPTVASTGGPTQAISAPTLPMSAAPPGAVPQMGAGEAGTPPSETVAQRWADTSNAASPVALASDPKLVPGGFPGIVSTGIGPVPYAGVGATGSGDGLEVLPTAAHETVPTGDPGSPAPSLVSKDVPASPTDSPRGPPVSGPRPEESTVKGAPPASLFQRLGMGDWNTSRMLLSLAAGFGGAHNIGEGIGRAAGNMAGAIPDIQKSQMSVAGVNLTAQYLQSKGLNPNEALAAAINPEIAKGLLPILQGTGNTVENGVVFNARKEPIADIRDLLGIPKYKLGEIKSGGEESTVEMAPNGPRQLHIAPSGANTVGGHRFALPTNPSPGYVYTDPESHRRFRLTGKTESGQAAWQELGAE
jgi:hypothetical protein